MQDSVYEWALNFRNVMIKKVFLACFATIWSIYAMGQASCTDNPSDGNMTFFSFCQAGSSYTYTGNYLITVGNGITLTINGNVTINGTLTINLLGSTSILEVLSPYTLHATNMTFSGSATAKNLIVDGPSGKIVVDNTLNFGGLSIDLDGSGNISAGTITGADNISCNNDSNCPNTTASSCSPSGSSFCTAGGFVLPIELEFFKGEISNESVALSWSTSTEINFDYFSVERSGDGKTFNEIGQIKGHGTTNTQHNYSYEDNNPIVGRSYYRLTSNDFDGYQQVFKVVSMDYQGEKSFSVSPNPSDGTAVRLNFNFENETDGQVTIYDNVGSVIGSYPMASTGSINFSRTLTSGIYMAKYTSMSFTKTERFLVK
jgi:hypothetical protein